MTEKQQQALAFIERFIAENGRSPSYRNIADGCGLKSPAHAYQLVEALEAHGRIVRTAGRAHGISVAKDTGLLDCPTHKLIEEVGRRGDNAKRSLFALSTPEHIVDALVSRPAAERRSLRGSLGAKARRALLELLDADDLAAELLARTKRSAPAGTQPTSNPA